MHQITQQTEHGTRWMVNLDDFENPDTLIEWLQAAADPTEYRVEGYNVWASDNAINDAITALEAAIDEDERRPR